MRLAAALALLVASALVGTAASQVGKPAPIAQPPGFVPCTQTPDATGLTGCEQMLFRSLNLQAATIAASLKPLQAQYAEAVAGLEAAHPGMKYEASSEQYPSGRLVKAPAPAPPPK